MTKFMVRGVVVASLIAVTASLAVAQQDGNQGGRRGGRGGRGGFGGGFGLGGLVAMPTVQKEIGLSEADAAKLAEELQALRPQRGQGGGFDFQNLSDEERQKRMEEFRKQREETNKKTEALIKKSVTDAQFKRLEELQLQRQGVMALANEEIAKKLELTADQKDKIGKLMADLRPQFGRRGGGANAAGGERPNFEEMRARREKAQADMLAVLTPAQKTQWEGMQGEKFEFPAPQFGGPGGGGRRNRPAAE